MTPTAAANQSQATPGPGGLLTCPPSLSRRPPAALGCPTRVMWPGLPSLRDAHCKGWWSFTFPAGGSPLPTPRRPPPALLCPQALPCLPLPQQSSDLLQAPKCTGHHWAPDRAWFRCWREAHLPMHALLTAWPLDPLCSWAWAAGTETWGREGTVCSMEQDAVRRSFPGPLWP